MDTFKSLIGLGQKPQSQGPDASMLAAQQREERKLQEAEAREARETGARQRIINATQQRGGPVTLFKRSAPARSGALGA